jgi:hypothetical protein
VEIRKAPFSGQSTRVRRDTYRSSHRHGTNVEERAYLNIILAFTGMENRKMSLHATPVRLADDGLKAYLTDAWRDVREADIIRSIPW